MSINRGTMQSDTKKFSSSQMRQIDDLRKNRDNRVNSSGPGVDATGILKNGTGNMTNAKVDMRSSIPNTMKGENNQEREIHTPCHTHSREELLPGFNPFQTHLDKLLDRNVLYFNHLAGNCICGRCICGRCKCPQWQLRTDHKPGAESVYQTDFIPHKGDGRVPNTAADFFSTYRNKQPMDLKTTNRHDFKGDKVNPPESFKDLMRPNTTYVPFAGFSSYRNEYINWGSNPTAAIKPPFQQTVVKDLPFNGRTIYKDSYQGAPGDYDPETDKLLNNARHGAYRSPLSPDFPFLGETTNMNAYKPFKTFKFNDGKSQRNRHDHIPTYDGQFKSVHNKEFDEKPTVKCPSRVLLNRIAAEKGVLTLHKFNLK